MPSFRQCAAGLRIFADLVATSVVQDEFGLELIRAFGIFVIEILSGRIRWSCYPSRHNVRRIIR